MENIERMEGVLYFISVIMLIFGILQIILFFKIWGMTNNVARINKKVKGRISGLNLGWEIRKSILKGDKKKAEDLLFDEFIYDLQQKCSIQNGGSDEEIAELKVDYSKYYEQIGSKLPESIQCLKSKEDFYKVFTFSI